MIEDLENIETYHIKYDGATFRIEPQLPDQVNTTLETRLSYTDSSAEYAQKKFIEKMKRAGRRVNIKSTVKVIKLYDRFTQVGPTGLLQLVFKILKTYGIEYKRKLTITLPEKVKFELPEKTYEDQRTIYELFLKNARLSAELTTGQGKTFLSALCIKSFPNAHCLFVTSDVNLLHQGANELEEVLKEPIGMIGDSKYNWQRVTVGIVNSVHNCIKKYPEELKQNQVIIWDECHKLGGNRYQEISMFCSDAMYRLGLSGTAYRNGSDKILITAASGPLLFKQNSQKIVEDKGWDLKYFVVNYEHPKDVLYSGAKKVGGVWKYPNTWNGKPDDQEVYKLGIELNEERNNLFCKFAEKHFKNPESTGTCLVLGDRREQCFYLQRKLSNLLGIEVPLAIGSQTKRNLEIQEEVNAGKHKVLVSSRVFNLGVHMPSIELVLLCSGFKDSITLYQKIGRTTRGNKIRCWVIDAYDIEPYYLEEHSRQRVAHVKNKYPNSVQLISKEELLRKL